MGKKPWLSVRAFPQSLSLSLPHKPNESGKPDPAFIKKKTKKNIDFMIPMSSEWQNSNLSRESPARIAFIKVSDAHIDLRSLPLCVCVKCARRQMGKRKESPPIAFACLWPLLPPAVFRRSDLRRQLVPESHDPVPG